MLVLRCTLLRGVFEGTRSDDTGRAEWPPSWFRVFSALVAVSEAQDDPLLERLERALPPEVRASSALRPPLRQGFVPTNATHRSGSTTWPDRTNSERSWARTIPLRPDVSYVWPDVELPPSDGARLGILCRRIAYVGRSTSPALVEVVGVEDDTDHGVEEPLVPRLRISANERFEYRQSLRAPGMGTLVDLRLTFQTKHVDRQPADPWQAGHEVEYGHRRPAVEPPERQGGYEMLVVLALEGRYLDGRLAPAVVHAFRRTVQERAERAVPALTEQAEGCAFLPLPSVGHQHSDGHLLGLAVAIPPLDADDLRVVARALGAVDELLPVVAGALGVLQFRRTSPLDADGARGTRWGLQPRRWQGPAARWVTALPAVLGDIRDQEGAIAQVAAGLHDAGLPQPAAVTFSDRPLIQGAVKLQHRDAGYRAPGRLVHVAVEFPQPVRGPLLVGSHGVFGLGLCAPVTDAR